MRRLLLLAPPLLPDLLLLPESAPVDRVGEQGVHVSFRGKYT
jgi:hypothetical protein